MEDRKKYIDKIAEQLKEWDSDIKKLEAKAKDFKATADVELKSRMADLKVKRDEAQVKLQELGKSSDEAWQVLRAGTEKSWKELKQALTAAYSKFNKTEEQPK